MMTTGSVDEVPKVSFSSQSVGADHHEHHI